MKFLGKMTMALSALALCAACTNEDDVFKKGETSERDLTATIPAYQFDDGTRVNISDDLQTFTWSDNDELGIYYSDSSADAQAGYKIKQGGSSTGVFSNDIFYLNPEKTYHAFYPYNSGFTTTAAEVDFTGQVQTANASAAHLGAYNYMYGSVNIGSNGGASVAFKNLGSVMQLQLTASNPATFTGIDITSGGVKFITKGKASMIDGAVTATETSSSIHLSFQSGITLNAGDVLTANILVAPVDMSDSDLTITVKDSEGEDYVVTTAGKNMLQGKAYLYAETLPYIDVKDIPYVTFLAESEQTFQVQSFSSNDYGEETLLDSLIAKLEYSIDNQLWTNLESTSIITFGGNNGNLRLRGKNLLGTAKNSKLYTRIIFGSGGMVSCVGDIRTLMDYESYETITSSGDFNSLFKDCVQLTSTPTLPATSLTNNCYREMFRGCTSLTQAPELPATVMEDHCYANMFYGCTSLIEAPSLPALSLAGECYSGMFQGCISLTEAPELPATTMAGACYYHMFNGCTSLTEAPELPAMTLASGCYSHMFNGCTSLTEGPELPATSLEWSCYRGMFQGCTSLTKAPYLPATTVVDYCYMLMFYGCSSLTSAPDLLASNTAFWCYRQMFHSCTNLHYIRMMATDISASECLEEWTAFLTHSGTFVKSPSMTTLPIGWNGIPEGWTVIDYTDSTGPDMHGSDMGGDW